MRLGVNLQLTFEQPVQTMRPEIQVSITKKKSHHLFRPACWRSGSVLDFGKKVFLYKVWGSMWGSACVFFYFFSSWTYRSATTFRECHEPWAFKKTMAYANADLSLNLKMILQSM